MASQLLSRWFLFLALTLSAVAAVAARPPKENPPTAPNPTAPNMQDALLNSLAWREVGPYRGGRSAAVTGIPGKPEVYYFGATGGGVWKTTDAGKSWNNVSDGFFGGSIGAVAVSAWDPNVVYVGGGEKTLRGNVSHGDGMWKSTDAGKTWKAIGLENTRHIARIRIHPQNPDWVWVAALGHVFGPNPERGIYRSTDGGKTWQRVLFVNDEVGAVDLALDPTNPRILYAAFWRARRTGWSFASGGPGSGIWKSTDSGDTWEELTHNPGLPKGTLGISGITVSATNPENLYAIVEAEEGGVFRSRDAGKTWTRTHSGRDLRQRAWYYSRITADPADPEVVYVLNVAFHRSQDGGKTFTQIATPHSDNHDLWIAPEDPQRMIESNDGGANISLDGGKTWSPQNNQPTAQIYRVATDTAFPYRLLGGQQDNTALRIRSRSALGKAIGPRDFEPTAGGESGYVVAKPNDPDLVFGGSYGGYLTSFNHRTGESRAVNVWPDNPIGWGAAELKYRFQWNFPLFLSPHDPELLYAAGNILFKSRDQGHTWEAISPDLTRNDKSKQQSSGGPITQDNTGVEVYGTIFTALESPHQPGAHQPGAHQPGAHQPGAHQPGVLWTGSDDGLIHLSRDGGKTWKNVTPKTLPEAQINSLEIHPFAPGGLYCAATRYKFDDFRPLLYRTTDWGETWTEIVQGIDPQHFTRVIRADPVRQGLLFAGTERGVYVSWNDGGSWQPLPGKLPIVPVTDLLIRDEDLIAATQGRGFWILDDLSPLRQLNPGLAAAEVALLTPRPAYRLAGGSDDDPVNQGKNPPAGVLFHYFLSEKAAASAREALRLELFAPDGSQIRSFTVKPKPGEDDKGKEGKEGKDPADLVDDPRQLEAEPGMNRLVWDLRYPSAERFAGLVLWSEELPGPRAVPGDYRARLVLGELHSEVAFKVLADPRTSATPEDFAEQFAFHLGLRDQLTRIHREITRLRQVRTQLEALQSRLVDPAGSNQDLAAAVQTLRDRLTRIEETLYQTRNQSPQDPLNYPIRLNDKLALLMDLASMGDQRPTASMRAVRDELSAAVERELAALAALWEKDLPALNRLAQERGVPLVSLPPGLPNPAQ